MRGNRKAASPRLLSGSVSSGAPEERRALARVALQLRVLSCFLPNQPPGLLRPGSAFS